MALLDSSVKIVKADGTIGTTNKASAVSWTTSDVYTTYGSSSDLWGESWTAENINDADFGVVISVVENSGVCPVPSVDHIRITIYYTNASGVTAGATAFASNGRKAGEGAGVGTGLLVYYDGTNWIASDTGATVAA